MVAAVLGAGAVAYAWLWNAIGCEVVGLRPGVLVIRRDVAGLGLSREFRLADVRNLRVSLPPSDAARWAPPLRFGREAEASLVVAEMGLRPGIERLAA
jgi:hypothetical protein